MSALSIQPTFPIFTETDGQPLENGYIWIGAANLDPQVNPINVYWDAALTQLAGQPIRTEGGYPVNNGTPARLYVNSDYSIRVMNKNGSTVYSAPAATERYSDVVLGGINAADVQYDPAGLGAVPTTVQAKLRETVSVKDFGAVGDGVTDDTAAIQAAIDATQLTTGSTYITATHPSTLYIPAGVYKVTDTLQTTGNLNIVGDGGNVTIINFASSLVKEALVIGPTADNEYMIGCKIGGFRINCSEGSAVCAGIRLRTGNVNSVITQCAFNDIQIFNSRIAFNFTGVLYMNDYTNVRSVGSTLYGFYAADVKENIYNSYTNLEATNVGDGAWAYYMTQNAEAQMINITADGCCYFGGAYTGISGLAVEGIAAATPASTTCITFDQISSAKDIAIINVPNAKCSIGITVIGSVSISGVRFPDAGAGNQPNLPLHAPTNCFVNNVQMTNCVARLDASSRGTSTFVNCGDILDANLSYSENTWSPGFASWSTAPTVAFAKYIKIGNQVTVFINAYGGACADYSTITGLPFTSSSSVGGTAQMSSGDVAKRFAATITTSSTTISHVPAQSLTAGPVFWQLTATYPAA